MLGIVPRVIGGHRYDGRTCGYDGCDGINSISRNDKAGSIDDSG